MFGPTLLTTKGSASLSSLVDTVHQIRVVELLVEHANTIFGSNESKINLVSLKDFSGLEGVRTSQLSTQDSVDHGRRLQGETSEPVAETPGDNGQAEPSLPSSIVSISQENRVKIQVPGPGQPHGKTSKTGGDH